MIENFFPSQTLLLLYKKARAKNSLLSLRLSILHEDATSTTFTLRATTLSHGDAPIRLSPFGLRLLSLTGEAPLSATGFCADFLTSLWVL